MKLIPWRRSSPASWGPDEGRGRRRRGKSGKRALDTPRPEEPNPAVAFAVGLVYVFGTRPGHRILRDLERAVRRYAADPAALLELVRGGDEAIDTTATVEEPPAGELADRRRNRLPEP